MNAKEYLSQAFWLDRVIQNKLEQKERLEAMAQKVTVDFTKEKVLGGNNTTSPMEDATVKLIDLSHEINDDIDRLIDLKREILATIKSLEDTSYQLLLEMRYINNKNWDDVAVCMGYDRRWVMRLHGRALKEIDKILKEATRSHRKPHNKCSNI
jgi:DNA-directed RNA polymerase specialized sigma subunit